MATKDMPAALLPSGCTVQLNRLAQTYRSPFGGSPQVGDVLAERWALSLSIPPSLLAESGEAEALVMWLAGGYNRVRVTHPVRPTPASGLHGSPTLYASIAAGATALVITGGSGKNRLANAGMDTDANANGVADGWTNYSAGTTGTITRSMVAGISGTAQRHACTGLGTGNGDNAGSSQDVTLTVAAGASVCASASLRGTAGAQGVANISFYDSGASLISTTTGTAATLSASVWQRVECAAVVPSGAVTARVRAFMRAAPVLGAAQVDIDNTQFEEAATEASAYEPTGGGVLAGDILGLNGQWLQVADSAQADANGRISVTLNNRLRDAVSAGAAITWDHPTIDMSSTSGAGVAGYGLALSEGVVLDIEEAWG